MPAPEAAAVVRQWRGAFPVIAADEACLIEAMDAVIHHTWSFWDALLWATARRHGCRLLLSEDGQSGRTLGGVTIVDPFGGSEDPLLTAALAPAA